MLFIVFTYILKGKGEREREREREREGIIRNDQKKYKMLQAMSCLLLLTLNEFQPDITKSVIFAEEDQ